MFFRVAHSSFLLCVVMVLFAPAFAAADKASEVKTPVPVRHKKDADQAPKESTALPALLSLNKAKEVALRENPSLQAGASRVEQAKLRVKQMRASFFPLVEASLSGTDTWLDAQTYSQQEQLTALVQTQISAVRTSQTNALLSQLQTLGVNAPSDAVQTLTGILFSDTTTQLQKNYVDYRLAVTARWQLFDGLSREFGYAAAKVGAREADAAFLEGKRLLLSGVATSYFTALLAREEIAVTEADEAYNIRLKKEAETRYEAGAAGFSDTLNFEVRSNLSHNDVIRAKQGYVEARVALAGLLGLSEGALPDDVQLEPLEDETERELENPPLNDLLVYAKSNRPDLEQADLAIDRTNASAKAWHGQMLPSVGLSATEAAVDRNGLSISSDNRIAAVSVGVSQTLFAGGRIKAKWEEAKVAHAEARHSRDATEIKVASEVRNAHEKLLAAQQQLHLQRSNAGLVQQYRDLVEQGYLAGQLDLVQLNQAQRDLTAAQGQLVLARVGVRQAWHDLYTAAGKTLEGLPEE